MTPAPAPTTLVVCTLCDGAIDRSVADRLRRSVENEGHRGVRSTSPVARPWRYRQRYRPPEAGPGDQAGGWDSSPPGRCSRRCRQRTRVGCLTGGGDGCVSTSRGYSWTREGVAAVDARYGSMNLGSRRSSNHRRAAARAGSPGRKRIPAAQFDGEEMIASARLPLPVTAPNWRAKGRSIDTSGFASRSLRRFVVRAHDAARASKSAGATISVVAGRMPVRSISVPGARGPSGGASGGPPPDRRLGP